MPNLLMRFAAQTSKSTMAFKKKSSLISVLTFGAVFLASCSKDPQLIQLENETTELDASPDYNNIQRISIISIPDSGDAFVLIIKDNGIKSFQTSIFGHGFAHNTDLEIPIPEGLAIECGNVIEWSAFAYVELNHGWETTPLGIFKSHNTCDGEGQSNISIGDLKFEVNWGTK